MLQSVDNHSFKISTLILVVLCTVAVVIGGFALVSSGAMDGFLKMGESGGAKTAAPATASGYVAVFLSNKQVYFGLLKNAESDFPTLSDVFYLRVTQTLAPGTAGSVEDVSVVKNNKDAKDKIATPSAGQQLKNQLTLIKLGNEIHGPTDSIRINRDQIVFVETLKDDSKVVKAINDYRQKNP
jgi:hypothetical protein